MSSASGAAGTSASAGAQGQRPTSQTQQQQNNDPSGSSATSGQNGASGTNPPPDDGGAITNPEAKRYADEAAQYRKQLRDVEAELKKFRDKDLTDSQKLERDYTESQAKNLEYEATIGRLTLELAGLRLAPSLGIADPIAALALVQAEHAHEIKVGADGRPENLDELLKAVLKAHPLLAGQPLSQRQAQSGTNPGRQAGNGGLTLEIIKAMPMRERMARMDEIRAWEKAQQQS